MTLIWILFASILVSLISLVGIFTIGIKTKTFGKIVFLLVGFSAGGLIGGAFLHLLPEAIEKYGYNGTFFYTLIGFITFFLLERFFYWRHCHNETCEIHSFTYLILIGDGVHNFIDGLVIAASFMTDFKLGVATTIAVALHEIPQEIGDFAILVYGGFSKAKALLFNSISALIAVLGSIIGYIILGSTENISVLLVSFTAGGFIYIAACDLIPQIHKHKETKSANFAFVAFILGLLFMSLLKG